MNTIETTPVVRVSSTAGLLSVVPQLLGFIPDLSMVVLGVDRDRVKVTFRYDLPEPPDAQMGADLVGHAVSILFNQRLTRAVAVGYGPAHLVDPVARALLEAASEAGLEIPEILRVQDGLYWSYMCRDEECCAAAGTPFRLTVNRQLRTALADRAAVAAQIAPLGGADATRMAGHVQDVVGLAAVAALIANYRADPEPDEPLPDDVAQVTAALRSLRVRDDAWARMDPAHSGAHLRMWIDVVRRAQPGYVAAPASLLAFTAWQGGEGVLANVALDRALADDPGYSMALLLRQVIGAGAPPSMARLPMTPAEVATSYDEQDH